MRWTYVTIHQAKTDSHPTIYALYLFVLSGLKM